MLVHNKIGLPFCSGNVILCGNYKFAWRAHRGNPKLGNEIT
jgi:hypothetical protein